MNCAKKEKSNWMWIVLAFLLGACPMVGVVAIIAFILLGE